MLSVVVFSRKLDQRDRIVIGLARFQKYFIAVPRLDLIEMQLHHMFANAHRSGEIHESDQRVRDKAVPNLGRIALARRQVTEGIHAHTQKIRRVRTCADVPRLDLAKPGAYHVGSAEDFRVVEVRGGGGTTG